MQWQEVTELALCGLNVNSWQGDGAPPESYPPKTPFNIVTKEIYPDDPICEKAIHPARTWINDCVHNHTLCNLSDYSLPKRVLELTDSKIYLRENQGTPVQAKYACLSHCWGPQGPTIKLTSRTEADLLEGIAVEELPRTFSEATRVCLKLGLSYLWIDALCTFNPSRSHLELANAS